MEALARLSSLDLRNEEHLRPGLDGAEEVDLIQFAVDRDGTVCRLMQETWMARHTIGLNRVAVGVENVGGPRWPLTPEQLNSNAELVRYLRGKYPSIQYLIGHNEYLRFRGTSLWEEKDSRYVTGKQDPGERFMTELRARVTDLRLRDRPP